MTSILTKQAAARRQLLAAIHIHWYLTEPLAVYTLAANAWEVCDALLEKRNANRLLDEVCRTHGSTPREIKYLINKPRNYLKHADRDADATLPDVDHLDCDAVLETACIDYMVLMGRSPFAVGLYVAWYSAKYPEKTGEFFRREAEQIFPGLSRLGHLEQISAARKAFQHSKMPEILHSSKNDLTDNWRWQRLRRLSQTE